MWKGGGVIADYQPRVDCEKIEKNFGRVNPFLSGAIISI